MCRHLLLLYVACSNACTTTLFVDELIVLRCPLEQVQRCFCEKSSCFRGWRKRGNSPACPPSENRNNGRWSVDIAWTNHPLTYCCGLKSRYLGPCIRRGFYLATRGSQAATPERRGAGLKRFKRRGRNRRPDHEKPHTCQHAHKQTRLPC